jgi:tRNA pseudouridine13 synthase
MKYATDDIPPCPGVFKQQHEDFRVAELPLYPFSGSGDHTLVHIRKRGLTTFEAIRRLCRVLDFKERDVGYAGLKDRQGVTSQWLSFEHVPPERLEGLSIPGVEILEVTRHGNKLKRGHLLANRFEITLREVEAANVPHARATLERLQARGVPNWYDDQRFGMRGDNAECGLAILRHDYPAYFDTLLGGPDRERDAATKAAREAYEAEGAAAALELWPRRANLERTALKALKDFGPTEKALRRLPRKLKQLQVSAVQSLLFNRVLERRFDSFDRVLDGDLCRLDNGADFLVTDAAAEQPRADAFEISPTGPVFGYKMQPPAGEVLALEQAVLAEAGLTAESFDAGGGLSQKGDRRPLRFRLEAPELGYEEGSLRLAFTLPKGCYATVVLKEVVKTGNPIQGTEA